MNAWLVAAAIFLVTGCAVQKDTYLPDGAKGHSIQCSGSSLSWNACYEKAGALCGERGYEVVASGAEHGTVVTGTQYGLFGSSLMKRSMLIKCRG